MHAACACQNGQPKDHAGSQLCACSTKKPATEMKAEQVATPSANGEPDFRKMTQAEKIAYHKARWDRILG